MDTNNITSKPPWKGMYGGDEWKKTLMREVAENLVKYNKNLKLKKKTNI